MIHLQKIFEYIPHKHPFIVTNKEFMDYVKHNRKIINRLSRKIQRLKRELKATNHNTKEICNLIRFKYEYRCSICKYKKGESNEKDL